MKRPFTTLGMLLGLSLGLGASPATAQAIRVDVGFNTPPVSGRIIVGEPAYRWYYPAGGLWMTNAYLVRMHRRHLAWLAYEQARLDAMYHSRAYYHALRAFDRERLHRERELDRVYRDWLRDREHGRGRGHRH